MNACPWESIHGFFSPIEFERFLRWMQQQESEGIAVETSVVVRLAGVYEGVTEKWFKHIPSGEVWRLVWPDQPFYGVFLPVDGVG